MNEHDRGSRGTTRLRTGSGPSGTATSTPPFHSILFDRPPYGAEIDTREEPPFFGDLNLDQVLESMVTGRAEYRLQPYFYMPLPDVAAVAYRHDVLHDLGQNEVAKAITTFAATMRQMRKQLAQANKLHYKYQKERWFLDAIRTYCDAVGSLTAELTRLDVPSQGFCALREYLIQYTVSERFRLLLRDTKSVQNALSEVRYSINIKGNRVKVDRYEEVPDYSAEVEQTFAKFKQGAVKDYRVTFTDWPDMNHVEAQILGLVARLYPDVFRALDEYCVNHRDYLDPTIGTFDREVQFYLAYLDYMKQFTAAGLTFCYPQVSADSKEVYAYDSFDLALANKLVPEEKAVVCNDFCLTDPERIIVVSGPNQGGKTTFARMFGQLHYLAWVGLPVAGREARLFLPDQIFTHFEREEDMTTLRGKLEDELVRIHEILQRSTSHSIIVMNERFTSTTLRDALFLGKKVMGQIMDLDLLCVYVTFVDELATLSEATVSMVSTIVPDNPAERTFKVVRRPADGLAYAAALARKYGLTYEALRRRIAG